LIWSLLSISLTLISCGSGGGGNSSDVKIEGTLRSRVSSARILQAGEGGIAGVQVSALGDVDLTDSNGNFKLSSDSSLFPGGTVEFFFSGNGVESTAILDGVPGGEGAQAYADFIVEDSGVISGKSTDAAGNILGTTPLGASLGCPSVRVIGGGGELWKPVAESTGGAVILMPSIYQGSEFGIFNNADEVVDQPIRRSCCDHNGGREHLFLGRSASSLAGAGVPLVLRFKLRNGTTECRLVPNPVQRYE